MKEFGVFLSNLRSSYKVTLDNVVKILGYSNTTAISRLENNEIPQPYKGASLRLVIDLAELLCTSGVQTEQYLRLARINRDLLSETDKFRLGIIPRFKAGSPEEIVDLERWEHIYDELFKNLEERRSRLKDSNTLPHLKTKLQEYTNILQEIRRKLHRPHIPQRTQEKVIQSSSTTILEGRIIVGYMYGQELNNSSSSDSLYTLASPNAVRLMELADMDCFAVDDMMVLTNSTNFAGWDQDDIITTKLDTPLSVPNDIEALRQEKLPAIQKNFINSLHYRLYAYTPAFSDRRSLEVTLAPIGFHDFYPLLPFLDEPLLTNLDGSKVSIREKYGNTSLTYSSSDYGASLIPAPIALHCVIVTKDHQIILMQRSHSVAFYPGHWSASFEETMDSPGLNPKGNISRTGDADFFACATRGLEEELGIPHTGIEDIKVLSLNVEYLVLAVAPIAIIRVGLTAQEVKTHWLLKAPDKNEASKVAVISTELPVVVDRLFSGLLWHPTARMRLIQFLFYTYGIDEVDKAIKARNTSPTT